MGIKYIQAHENKTLSSGAQATLQIPVGGKVHSIMLHFLTSGGGNVTEAAIRSEIGQLRLTVNGKDVVNASAIKLLDLYEVLGRNVNDNTGVASVVELNVGRLVYTDPAARDLFGIGTNDVQSIQVQITAGTLSTIASVTAYTGREAVNENLGVYMRYINYNVNFNATGDHSYDTMPRDTDSSYLAVLTDAGASGTLTHGEVRLGNTTLKQRVPAAVNSLVNSSDRYATPSGLYVYSFMDGNPLTRLPMKNVDDLRFIQSFSVAPGSGGYNMSALTIVGLNPALK